MKRTIYSLQGLMLAAFAAIALAACGPKDIEAPKQSVLVDKPEILATTMEADFDVKVLANCDWEVKIEADAAQWVSASPLKGFGNKTVRLTVTTNGTPALRETTIVFAATGSDAKTTVRLRQPAATGNISVGDVRALASNLTGETTSYTITQDWELSAVVNTAATFANLPDIAFGVQDSKTAGSGIMVRPAEPLWKKAGTEIEISLKNAVLTKDANGVLELQPASDDNIRETATDPAQISPLVITRAQLLSGDYESMYVAVSEVQVTYDDLPNTMAGAVTLEDREFENFSMYVYENASFYEYTIPTGSGTLAGIASVAEGAVVILPVSESDFALNSTRFGLANGIALPYVFSLMAESTNPDDGMKYNTMRMADGSRWSNFFTGPPTPQVIEPTDGSGSTMTFWRYEPSATGNANNGVKFYVDQGNLDNIIALQIWGNKATAPPYVLLTYPIGEQLSGTVHLSFCLAGSGYGPRNWTVQYSDDNANWLKAADVSLEMKTDVPNFFTVPVTLQAPMDKGETLYLKLSQTNNLRVGGTEDASEGGVGRLASAIILQQPAGSTTTFPAGAVYSEGFDGLFGGVDYLLGDHLCNMKVYAGDNFAAWNTSASAGFSADNVGARPGYAQIGHVEYNAVQPRNLADNKVGSLTTPALPLTSVPTDITVHFKAMAYKTGSTMSNAKDKSGDKTVVRVEVVGGGEIGGLKYADITGLNYTEFKDFNVEISGATSATRIKFTSTADAAEFSRWFLDDIYVIKGNPSIPEGYGDPNAPGSGMEEGEPIIID